MHKSTAVNLDQESATFLLMLIIWLLLKIMMWKISHHFLGWNLYVKIKKNIFKKKFKNFFEKT